MCPARCGRLNKTSFVVQIPFSIFFAMWSIGFLSAWSVREFEYKFLWGTEGHEDHEKPVRDSNSGH